MQKGGHATLRVRHTTRFDYSAPVSLSHNVLRLTPVDTTLQNVQATSLTIDPPCQPISHLDYFGNVVHHFNLVEPHEFLEIVSESTVETVNAICTGSEDGNDDPRPFDQRLAEFITWSKGVPDLPEYATVPHAHEIRMEMGEIEFEQALMDVARYFSNNFRYDPDVTHVHSSPKALFEHGGGVCQDMAHALIGVLRLAGIPARYVSGYIYDAKKDEEGDHLRGAAATHAWVQAWHGKFGWVGIDPTNDKLVDWQYVRTAFGRDYYDVLPVSGLFRGLAEQRLQVSVQVKRLS